MMKSIAAIIAEAEKQKTAAKQAEILKQNSSSTLKTIVGYAMDPKIKWLLPETDPPYTAQHKAADQEGRLYAEARRLIYFIDSEEGAALKPVKREQLFIQLLESIDAEDAKLLLRVKNKALKLKKEAVKIAFPGISGHW